MSGAGLGHSLRALRAQFLAFFLGWLALTPISPLILRSKPTLIIDAEIDHGERMELFVNEVYTKPRTAPIAAGRRQAYKFEALPDAISTLRLDPTDVSLAAVRVYRVAFLQGDRVIKEFAPQELEAWPLANLRFATPAGEAAALLRATSSDPILWIPVPAALTLSYQMRFWMALLGLGFCAIYVYASLRGRLRRA